MPMHTNGVAAPIQTCTSYTTDPKTSSAHSFTKTMFSKKIPKISVALVLPNGGKEPSEDDYEKLRDITSEFWFGRLQECYPKQFKYLAIELDKISFSTKSANKFNLHLEVSAKATFSGCKQDAPSGDEIIRELLAGNSKKFLSSIVRNFDTSSPFSNALRVRIQRLVPVSFKVVSAPFYVAYVNAGTVDRVPYLDEMAKHNERTRKHIEENLRSEYPSTFVACELQVTEVQAEAKKPDERFSLYVGYVATATFSKDPPSPSELFSVIMRLARNATHLQSLHEIEGSPFADVTMMALRLIHPDLPPTPVPPPQEDSDGAGDGNQEDKEIINIDTRVFLALVIMSEPPAAFPTDQNLSEFRGLIEHFFRTFVSSRYKSMVDMDLKQQSKRYDAGIPEKRFNMCVEYNSRFRFKKESAPSKKELEMLVARCDLGAILDIVRRSSTLCFSRATEITMKEKAEKKKLEPMDPTFEAAFESPTILSPPLRPAARETTRVESSDIFVALKVDGIQANPTAEEYEKLRQHTSKFFEKRLQSAFPAQFVDLDVDVAVNEFGSGKPNPKYNVYIEWEVKSTFKSPDDPTQEPTNRVEAKKGSKVRVNGCPCGVPSPVELTAAIVKGVDFMDYLINYVRTLDGTVFGKTTAGYIRQRVCT